MATISITSTEQELSGPQELHSLDSSPRKPNGMKVGIMDLCKMFWEEKGYGYLGKTAQNVRDKLGHIDKQVRINKACITDELNKQTEDNERRANVNNDSIHLENNQQNLQCNRQGGRINPGTFE